MRKSTPYYLSELRRCDTSDCEFPAHVIAPIKHLWTLSHSVPMNGQFSPQTANESGGLMTSKNYRSSVFCFLKFSFFDPVILGSNRPTLVFINFLKYSTIYFLLKFGGYFSISIMNVHVKFRHMDVF